MKLISKNRILIIILFLIAYSIIFESPFQKGGINHYVHYIIYGITVILGFLFLLPFPFGKLIIAEKIIYPFISAFIGLTVSLIVTHEILEKMYGIDYQLNLNYIISNLIFYFLANIISIGILYLIVKLKKN